MRYILAMICPPVAMMVCGARLRGVAAALILLASSLVLGWLGGGTGRFRPDLVGELCGRGPPGSPGGPGVQSDRSADSRDPTPPGGLTLGSEAGRTGNPGPGIDELGRGVGGVGAFPRRSVAIRGFRGRPIDRVAGWLGIRTRLTRVDVGWGWRIGCSHG